MISHVQTHTKLAQASDGRCWSIRTWPWICPEGHHTTPRSPAWPWTCWPPLLCGDQDPHGTGWGAKPQRRRSTWQLFGKETHGFWSSSLGVWSVWSLMLRIAVGVILLVAFYVFFAEEMFFVKIPIPGEKKTSKSQVCLYMWCVFRS